MAKQLNVDMRFNADTSKAKQAINDLEQSLQKLGHNSMPANAGIDPVQFEKASAAARELEFHLKNAYNAKTGNLDLSKLHTSLSQSKTNLKDLTSNFAQAGSVGTQAFTSLARAIASADQPSLVLNTHLATMWTTLKNVARFQISSSIMHGLIGGVQQAYGYAQDLNKSLNNIRIVTGASTAEMARFAEQANKSARALSTTTLDYTDAALIYYQQGIRDQEEIASRVETTVKLANVSHQSAEEVSDQMTAIWNNFYDGSQSLEYYADVITALGAATASSSQEIAGGLEKFASVAQTVGLSYEYAASALATIVAQTRQSEDTVGTGLRTLFARFEGLKLGETLEDGVDLNKYSKALQTIGVNVLDANGNLREMDDILDDMGEKWDTLTQAQKVALAQTVGGVRQYTNLIALMDNWDKFQENLATAQGAEGALQQQAEIYAQSWEAARTRVKTAMQSIYAALIDENFFIGVDNTIEHMLNGVSAFIKEFGGVKSILTAVLSFAAIMLADRIGPAIQKIIQDIKILTGGAGKIYSQMQNNMSQLIDKEKNKKMTNSSGQMVTASNKVTTNEDEAANLYSTEQQAELTGAQQLLLVKTKLSAVNDKLSATEKMRAAIALSGIQTQIKANEDLAKELDKVKKETLDLIEAEKQKKQDKIDKQKNLVAKQNSNIYGASEQAVFDTTQADRNALFSLAKQGEIKIPIDTLRSQLDQAQGEVLKFSKSTHEALINAFATGDMTTIIQELKTSFSSFNIKNFINSDDILVQETQLKALQASLSDIIGVSEEVDQAFQQAFNANTPKDREEALKNLETVLQGFPEIFGQIVPSAEQFARNIGIPPSIIADFTSLRQEIAELSEVEEGLTPDNLEKMYNQMQRLAKEGKNFNQIKDAMKNIFKVKPGSELEKKIDSMINKFIELQRATDRTKKSVENFNPKPKVTGIQAITSFAGALGQVQTALRAVTSLTEAWNNQDLTFGEKLMSSFMSISMLIPSVMSSFSAFGTVISFITGKVAENSAAWAINGLAQMANGATIDAAAAARIRLQLAQDLVSTGLDGENAALLANTAATLASTGALAGKSAEDIKAALTQEIKNKLVEQGATGEISEAMALNIEAMAEKLSVQGKKLSIAARLKHIATIIKEKATMIATNPVYAALAVVIMAVVAALTLLHLASEKRKKDAENAAKEADIAVENAKKLQEEYEKVNTLLTAYEELYNKYKESGEGRDELNEKARELAKALGIENAELMIQAGLYDELLGKAKELTEEKRVESNQAALSAGRAAQGSVQASVENNEGNGRQYTGWTSGNSYVLELQNGGGTGAALSDEKITIEAMEAVAARYADQGVEIKDAGGGEYNIIVPNTPEGMMLLKQVTTDITAETVKRGGGADSELFMGAQNFIADQESAYQQLEEATKLIANGDFTSGLTIPENSINSVEDYTKAREELNKQLLRQYGSDLSQSQRDTIIDQYLKDNDQTSDYWLMFEAMEKAGITEQNGMDEFITKWGAWSPEEKQMVLQIIARAEGPINVEDIISGLDDYKDYFNYQTLTSNIEILGQLIKLAQEGKTTTEDWIKAYNQNPELFKNAGIMSETELAYMSNEDIEQHLRAEQNREQDEQRRLSDQAKSKLPDATQRRVDAETAVAQEEQRQNLIIGGVAANELSQSYGNGYGVFESKNITNAELAAAAPYLRGMQLAQKHGIYSINYDLEQDYEAGNLTEQEYQQIKEAQDFFRNNYDIYGYAGTYAIDDDLINDATVQEKNAKNVAKTGFTSTEDMRNAYAQNGYGTEEDYDQEVSSYNPWTFALRNQQNLAPLLQEAEAARSEENDIKAQILPEKTELDWINDFRKGVTDLGFNYDEVKEFSDHLQEAAKSSDKLADSLEADQKTSLLVAKSMTQLNKGVETLQSNWDKWNEALSSGAKESKEYQEAMKSTKKALGDVFGITDELANTDLQLSDNFIEAALASGDLEKAMQGDSEALDRLRLEASKDLLVQVAVKNGIDPEELMAQISDSLSYVQNYLQDLEIGANLDDAGFLAACNEIINASGMTAEQAQAYLASMGVDAEIETVDATTSDKHVYEVPKWKKNDEGYLELEGTEIKEFSHTSTGTKATALKITSAKKTSGGNIGLNASKIGGGGGKGGGGGGGKSSTKEKKNPTDEKDRYHTIKEKIQDAVDAYDKLSKAQDRAFGKERIKAMDGITNNLRLQIELQKKYLDEIRNYLEGDRAAVEALGATFDVNGVITNYDDLIAELVAKYNEGVDAFNNGGLDEDAFKEQYEEPFNDAKEAIDQYVETINLLQSEELNLIDKQNELVDQLREIAAYKLELHIDMDEDELKYLDFLLEMLGENAEDAVDRLDLLGQQFNTNRDEIAAYTTAIQDLLRLRGFTDEDVAAFIRGELTAGDLEKRGFTTDDIDKLREYRDAIQDNTTAMNDLAKEIEESFLNTLDDLNEKVDDAEERFEHFATMLEHFHNVVDIVGQDALGMSAETMKLLAKAAKENAIEMVKAAKTQLDSLNAVRAQAQAQLDAALEAQKNASTAEEKLRADEAVRYWSDTISEVTNRVEQAEEDLANALENALEGIQEMYTTMIEQATKEFERSVTGAAGSLEQLQNNFDRQKETQELYIPTYEKIYELTKLTRDINNSIDDTDNLWSKQELAKLQDEINQKMEDGVELTEHDVEELRKRYELKLAEAALEEAQDAKRTVRMSRDNEGNWSYVYTADENDVAAAEQSYEDKLYEYQQMNYEYIQELQGNIIQAEQDMTDQINDLDVTKFASKEAYLAEVQRIMDATQAKEQQYKDQLAQTLDQQGILYEEDWKRYNELTGYRMARDDQWVDNWNETILAQQTGFETLEEMFDQLTGAIGGPDEPGTYVGDITDAYAEMQASNERALNAAGTSMQTYEQDTVDAISGIDQQMEETQNQVDEFTNSMVDAMEGVSDFIGEWKNQYGEAVKSITEFNKDLYDSCNKLIKKLQDTYQVNADFEVAQAAGAAEALAGGNRGGSNGGGSSGGGSSGGGSSGNDITPTKNPYTQPVPPPDNGDEDGGGDGDNEKVGNIGAPIDFYDSLGRTAHQHKRKQRKGRYVNGHLEEEVDPEIWSIGGPEPHTMRTETIRESTPWIGGIIRFYCKDCNFSEIREEQKNHLGINTPNTPWSTRSSGLSNPSQRPFLKSGGYTGTWSAVSARTGMYTGSWNGPDLEENGRLAFLHQKELVLNASDTENFLSAVDMVRQISQTIDLQAASRSNGWNFLLPGVLSKEPDTLDQNVHIEAHFPNVTSHSEIEEAFTNLVGKASQFANR